MPVVQPYAISEPLSTAGRINMNHQIVPFTYINRDTGLRAVLKSEQVIAIPDSAANTYKISNPAPNLTTHFPVNMDSTLSQFMTRRFNNNDIFRSASEICNIFLVPQLLSPLSTGTSYPPGSTPPVSYGDTAAWWNNFLLTGDNVRDFPYGELYARLTTKSNPHTIH